MILRSPGGDQKVSLPDICIPSSHRSSGVGSWAADLRLLSEACKTSDMLWVSPPWPPAPKRRHTTTKTQSDRPETLSDHGRLGRVLGNKRWMGSTPDEDGARPK